MSNETAGQRMAAEVGALLKARNSFLWVVTPEEGRVERALIGAAMAKGVDYPVRLWDCIAGVVDPMGKDIAPNAPSRPAQDPAQVLNFIRDTRERSVWILRDLHKWMDPTVLRSLRNLAKSLPKFKRPEARAIIVLSPSADVPPELQDHAIVIKWELPDRAEIGNIFDGLMKGIEPEAAEAIIASGVREAAIEAAVGLSAEAAASCFAKSLVTQGRKIVPGVIAAEKKRVISKEKGIEWFDPDPRGLDAIGGLENLKAWLTLRRQAFSQRARDFGLPAPKGCLIVGPPGGGKSLTARALAAAWQVPLLKIDLGGMKSKWVGESEAAVRSALAVVDAVGACVCWLDEVEKQLGGATQGAADGGVSSDALGVLLTWMQEHKGGAFVVATANDVTKLPPELLRKGRFDELWALDLPTQKEREEILAVTLKQYKRGPGVDVREVALKCDGFVGAEIAALVPDALFIAFAEGERELTTEDLLNTAATVTPLSKTAAEKISALREWGKTRARMASKPEVQQQMAIMDTRSLDL